MKVHLDSSAIKFKKEIEQLLENEALYNCNFSQVEWEILSGDNIYIDDFEDELLGACILTKIMNKIEELNNEK